MTAQDVYEDYLIPMPLQFHMQRVTGVAKVIVDTWTGPIIDKAAVVQACLYHDMGKPMTFDLNKQLDFGMTPAEIAQLAELQLYMRAQYGESEHDVTLQICEEIGCLPKAIRIVDKMEWKFVPSLMRKKDYETLIAIYADMRVGPKGILSLKDRLSDLKKRTGEDHGQMPYELEKFLSEYAGLDLCQIGELDVKMQILSLIPLNEVVS